ncbi:FAD/NAD(P)-binding protein [Dyadobacter sp. NIV53]|uniref:FAD/NAD(P)-binding protein n=1 Tax=Dyadobacter sp. NIV53 TaxID=2861765 RepID=UPI001C883137|nr:FAD/NAD(P)-binding protein [Dyadobacter sp. NIV53]
MTTKKLKKRIAILGGGPSGLFVFKRLVESNQTDFEVDIFESKKQLGAGMPYSSDGANIEHVTNVSDNEIPEIVISIADWVQALPDEILSRFNIEKEKFNEYKVLPRLFFGMYLSSQFDLLLKKAEKAGIKTKVHYGCKVTDIEDLRDGKKVRIEIEETGTAEFDCVIVCTGHKWPVKNEGKIPGYFDSPYPPAKLNLQLNHPVAIKGSSLTAIDAIRTLARNNGTFHQEKDGKVSFEPSADSPNFKLVMHSRSGMLPAIRFHLEEPLLSTDSLLSREELDEHISRNGGFLSLDFIFEKDFKDLFIGKDPDFHAFIKDLSMEEFVEAMMGKREKMEPFELFRAEYKEAEKSIKRRESVYWKEMLAVLSFAMNYPAKYLSAEDMLRLQKVLMPLISIVIAFAPQSSCDELLALNDAGKLDIVSVGDDSRVEPEKTGGVTYHYTDETEQDLSVRFETFVDCVGQPHLDFEAFPFKGLVKNKTISPALIKFKSVDKGSAAMAKGNKDVTQEVNGDYYLKVPGITINDNFQIVDRAGVANNRVYIMAVPYIGGFNPDYSGLDFCEQASTSIVESILEISK